MNKLVASNGTHSFGAGARDFWLIKADSTANMQWNKTYGDAGLDESWYFIGTTDEDYATVGITDSFGAGGFDFLVTETSVKGESGPAWTDSMADSITLYRGENDVY